MSAVDQLIAEVRKLREIAGRQREALGVKK